ncbi:MAG: hypothetical protein ACKOCT_22705 [Alphaproteobacteria bacterium]
MFRLDRMIDDVAARAGLVLDEPDRVERVEGLVEGALETWAELARQAEEALSRAPTLAALAESVGNDPVVRARTSALLRQAGRTWLQPRARGIERVPRRGPVLLAVTRIGDASGWDAVALRLLLEDDSSRPGAGLWLDPGLVASPVVSAALERTGGGAIDRRVAASTLRDGGLVAVFVDGGSAPAASRSRARRVDERVAVRLALATRASIVPVAISGGSGGGLLGRLAPLAPLARGSRIELAFGAPLRRGLRRAADAAVEPGLVARVARELGELLDGLRPAPGRDPGA